ncbi:hypothetical protein [Azospirillum sp. SYSU D00513]|uniref:hypothetical protein n=1 Tax=Azospirillum sp. SYSU D00513 TaxID=2812561 RepID=UPI001A966D70|nr:hypothetical protein [Azospirillum sp. SYSU D00513]
MRDNKNSLAAAFVAALLTIYVLYLVAATLLAHKQVDVNQSMQEKALLMAQCDQEEQGFGYVPRKPGEPDPCERFRQKSAPVAQPSDTDIAAE